LGNLSSRDFVQYAAAKVWDRFAEAVGRSGTALLKFIHGGGPTPIERKDLLQALQALNCALHITADYHSDDTLQFVRSLNSDLGIIYGTRILKPCLFSIPRLGSINIHKRKVPDYRGGGPVGLWELLDGQPEIGVTVHQVTEKLDAGAIVNSETIPIAPFDNLTSLGLKAHVIGNDLLVRSVAAFARSTVSLKPQRHAGRMYKAPTPQRLRQLTKKLAQRRPSYRPVSSRPNVKMLAKSLLALPGVMIRNWRRRFRGSFPVNILFHHLVADRPHRLGISTEYFLRHVRFLQKYYDIVSLREAVEMLEANNVKRPTVVLTFDDGYRDNFINLRAVVEETGVPVTMFISSDHISSGTEFNHDLENGQIGFLPLTWAQLRQMRTDGFEIGSHTRTHFNCGSQDEITLENEIAGSRAELAKQLQQPIKFFSFPFGLPENISPRAAQIAAQTYPYFVSAFGGENFACGPAELRHLRRWCHPNRLWDLELQLQGALETPLTPVLDNGSTERLETPALFAGRTTLPQ
jgi:peptidoglycan/xylan/chitin deacetylase (PgdA/CDA1 family)/folate-dependent phosphoribosylglycinamide formyltransferase PurN